METGAPGCFASLRLPARLQLLEQPCIGRFDIEAPRERGPWRLADAFEDSRVLVVGRVEVARQAHYQQRVGGGELAFHYLRAGFWRHSREALRLL